MGPGTHPGTVTFELGAAYELVSQDDLQIIVHDREPGDTVSTYSGRDRKQYKGRQQQLKAAPVHPIIQQRLKQVIN